MLVKIKQKKKDAQNYLSRISRNVGERRSLICLKDVLPARNEIRPKIAVNKLKQVLQIKVRLKIKILKMTKALRISIMEVPY